MRLLLKAINISYRQKPPLHLLGEEVVYLLIYQQLKINAINDVDFLIAVFIYVLGEGFDGSQFEVTRSTAGQYERFY